jgi:DNA helicase II / ATP-dependent DNA helicase PcrA
VSDIFEIRYEAGFVPTEAQRVVIEDHTGDLQVIACAGSGKTESISRRVAEILRRGTSPSAVVAFTFTEKAAVELKERITKHVRRVIGEDILGRLGRMYVGTIHGYCYRILNEHMLQVGNHDVLDEHQHQAFVHRHRKALDLENLVTSATGKKVPGFDAAALFISTVDAVGNELIADTHLAGTPFGKAYSGYRALLHKYRFLTFGLIIAEAVRYLEAEPEFRASVRRDLRHLVVDEYQDVNPAQERLIELLTDTPRPGEGPVNLCVVGDDDQAIYQWRGSDVRNILGFEQRQRQRGRMISVARLTDNRRSRPAIVKAANAFATSIPARLQKEMLPTREDANPSVVPWAAETELEEAAVVARHIHQLHGAGRPYSDFAVLLRSVKTSAPPLIAAFQSLGIPFNCGGRTGLFLSEEINAFGELFAWIADSNWREGGRFDRPEDGSNPYRPATVEGSARTLGTAFNMTKEETDELVLFLRDWKKHRLSAGGKGRISFVGDFYKILDALGIWKLDPDKNVTDSGRLGAYARFSHILADFESIAFRGRKEISAASKAASIGSSDQMRYVASMGAPESRNKIVWGSLANFLLNYAKENYEDFEGETTSDRDEVAIFTVHQAKGLEWPVIFLPALTNRRFPSSNSGKAQTWLLPNNCFGADRRARYEGGDADERRLFYVALTRARDAVYLSHPRRKTRKLGPSPYLQEVAGVNGISVMNTLPAPPALGVAQPKPRPVELSFSDLADHENCGHSYRLSRVFGFQREVAEELGYGKGVHHVMRTLAERRRATGRTPSAVEIDQIVETELFVPFANRASYEQMERRVKTLVATYVRSYGSDLERIWATERPFELRFNKGILAGRADVILDHEDGRPDSLAIVDYKVNSDAERDERYARQLQIYAAAARGELLTVEALYLHALRGDRRDPVSHAPAMTEAAVQWAENVVTAIAEARFPAQGEPKKCAECDYIRICRSRKAEPSD